MGSGLAEASTEVENRNTALLVWLVAGAVAGLGTWILYEAMPGLGWGLWTIAATAAVVFIVKRTQRLPISLTASFAGVAVLVALAAALTADSFMHAVIFLVVVLLLALTMLIALDPRLDRVSASFVIFAPFAAGGLAIFESVTRALDASRLVRSPRARSVLRGVAITAPVVIVFALLLAGADPVFASWRNAIEKILSSWAFLPRTLFFFALLLIVLGTLGYVARGRAQPTGANSAPGQTAGAPVRWLGTTERFILLASVAALFWIFLAVQLSYLFGNLPAVAGSGITFAEYARRGFGELSVVATCTVLLIVLSERYGQSGKRGALLRAVTLALIAAVLLLLASAFQRVTLYEAAYGFTTARLYAQVYMAIVAVTLVALAIETRGEIQPSRLFRRAALAALAAFIGLIYWNHEAWIARANIDRFATTGKLDVVYLTRDLSPNAIPAVVDKLPSLPEPARSQLLNAIKLRYEGRQRLRPRRWFEWNYGRTAARNSLLRAGVSLEPPDSAVHTPVVVR